MKDKKVITCEKDLKNHGFECTENNTAFRRYEKGHTMIEAFWNGNIDIRKIIKKGVSEPIDTVISWGRVNYILDKNSL